MNMDLISVIIPVYNVEKYLARCLESVINQTYRNIEIILVDDGSTDNSGVICDEYVLRDSRIKVIHKTNGGASSARNVGLDIMQGQWVTFVDSDDYIADNYVETLYLLCAEKKCNISSCMFESTKESDFCFPTGSFDSIVLSPREAMRSIYGASSTFITIIICAKLFSAELFSSMRFKEGIICEDEDLYWKLIYNSSGIACTSAKLYAYFMSANSVMRGGFSEKNLVIIDILQEREIFYKQKQEAELYALTLKTKCYVLHDLLSKMKTYCPEQKERLAQYRDILNQTYREVSGSKFLSCKTKVVLFVIRYMPFLYNVYKK